MPYAFRPDEIAYRWAADAEFVIEEEHRAAFEAWARRIPAGALSEMVVLTLTFEVAKGVPAQVRIPKPSLRSLRRLVVVAPDSETV